MTAFLVAVAIGFLVFTLMCERQYGPKVQSPKAVTYAEVWATLASAQRTVDDSLRLIYGRAWRE